MAAGEEKYLPRPRQGASAPLVRDYVDAGWHPAEFVMGVMVLVILALAAAHEHDDLVLTPYLVMMGYLVIAIGGMVLLAMRVKRKAAAKFGKERLERGLGWYAAMRALQMRFMRLPKPQVKRGQYPD